MIFWDILGWILILGLGVVILLLLLNQLATFIASDDFVGFFYLIIFIFIFGTIWQLTEHYIMPFIKKYYNCIINLLS